jgi:hypothetical protein
MNPMNKNSAAVLLAVALSAQAFAECTTNRNADIAITKPDSQYTDHGDGTVTDNETGLMWQSCSLGQSYNAGACDGTASTMNWQQALAAAQTANMNTDFGYNDWRLPNITQLNSLTDDACYKPSINETLFPATVNGTYWSASSHASLSNSAWVVSFMDSRDTAHVKGITYYVRLVRASQ